MSIKCKAYEFVPTTVTKTAQYTQVAALLFEHDYQRNIARMTDVAQITDTKQLIKKRRLPRSSYPEYTRQETHHKEWKSSVSMSTGTS